VIKFVICLTLGFSLHTSVSAQQSLSGALNAPALPNAPTPQLSVMASIEVAEISNSLQSGSPTTEQTPQPAAAQASTSQPASAATQTPDERRIQAEKEISAQEKQRMLGVIPNFNTVMSGEAAPIDAKEKFHLFFRSSIDPFQFVAAGVDALIEQGENSYPEYGQGFVGYSKRYGASFADGFDGNFWGNAVLPSLLHQDPRYFRLGHGGFKRRVWYSVISSVRCKGDNGRWQPSYSNIGGNFIGGAISNLYYPAEDRGVGLTLQRGLVVTAEGAIGSFAVEFYPDVVGWYQRRHERKIAAAKP